MKVRVKDAEVGLEKSHSTVADEAPSIEGLEVGLLGVGKGVGRNWRQGRIEFTYKRAVHELKGLAGPSGFFILRYRKLQLTGNSRREERERESKEEEIENVRVFSNPFRIELPRK